MPLSQCPSCGFICRSMFFSEEPHQCPECEREMKLIGRAALDERRPVTLPRVPLQARTQRERLKQRLAG